MAKEKSIRNTQISVKNLETGQVIKVGADFLKKQAKPVIGANGKGYHDGIWVAAGGGGDATQPAPKAPKSPEAIEIIGNAGDPV